MDERNQQDVQVTANNGFDRRLQHPHGHQHPRHPPTNTSFTAVPIYTPFMLYRVELEHVGEDF